MNVNPKILKIEKTVKCNEQIRYKVNTVDMYLGYGYYRL